MSIRLTPDILDPCILEDGKTIITTLTNYGYLFYTLNTLFLKGESTHPNKLSY